MRICERNILADTTVCEERGAGGAPGVRDSPAVCGEDQTEAAVPLKPKEHQGEVGIHTAARGGLHVETSGYA